MSKPFLNTENDARAILSRQGYWSPNWSARQAIAEGMNLPVPPTSFDMVEAPPDIDLEDEWAVRENFRRIHLIEVKGTRNLHSAGHCSLHITMNEVALSNFLGPRLKLAIVDVDSRMVVWDSIPNVIQRATFISTAISLNYRGVKNERFEKCDRSGARVYCRRRRASLYPG